MTTTRAMTELVEGFEQRLTEGEGTPSGGRQARALDNALIERLAAARETASRGVRTDLEVPRRRVGIAMALSVLSSPHFAATLPPMMRIGTTDPADPTRTRPVDPLLVSSDVLEAALELPRWELEELREETDRRVGWVLKRDRLAQGLWSRFETEPRRTADALFPERPSFGPFDVVRRGANLYVLPEQQHEGAPPALWLPWYDGRGEWATTGFDAHRMDDELKSKLALGIGVPVAEVETLLQTMVAVIPAHNAQAMLRLDRWRAAGFATLTDLGASYAASAALNGPLTAAEAEWTEWIDVSEPKLGLVGTAEQAFDRIAYARVESLMRAIYAMMLARIERDGLKPAALSVHDLALFDLPRHFRAVLQPVVDATTDAAVRDDLVQALGRPEEEVRELMTTLNAAWSQHAVKAWWGLPPAPSILTIALQHLLALFDSLSVLMGSQPDPRAEHADLMLLFTAHYLREAPLERLWIKKLSDCVDADDEERLPPAEDIAGHWFWRTFFRIVDRIP
ncbi:MAG: hypothetical protein AAGA48_21385 [Myxococcota bacterium]